MLSRRVSGGFVCLRCRLTLASRRRTQYSPFQISNINNNAGYIAASRHHSDSARQTTWAGRLPIDEPENVDVARGERDGHAPTSDRQASKDLPPSNPPRPHDVGGAKDPWQGVFEDVLKERSVIRGEHTRQNATGDTEGQQERGNRREKKNVYRHIKVSGKTPGKSRSRAPVTLATAREFYTAKGQRLKPDNRSLPIDILGRPGHALVLRDAGPRRKKQLDQMDADEPGPLLNLAKIYESAEVHAPSSAEVLSNIHELRPAENVLARRDFDKLKQTLHKGFTKPQLAAYIQKSLLAEGSKDGSTLEPKPWLLEKWPWVPEAESDLGATDAMLQGYVSKSTSPKERLVIGLMRHCWGVGIQELQSQQGYLDLRVQDLQFDLLMLASRGWLESISKSLLEPGTQIEMIRSEKIVRIVAPKLTAELILQELTALLDHAQTRLLHAAQISPKKLDKSVLDEVGRITNTVLRYDASGKGIQVSWIAPRENQRDGLEDLADVAYRLLYSAYGYEHPGENTMEVQPEAYDGGGWYLLDYDSKGKMAWRDRLSKWARWAIATPHPGAGTAEPVEKLANDMHFRNLDANTLGSFAADGWSVEPRVTTKAVFGHVLHREPISSSVKGGFADDATKDKPSEDNLAQTRDKGVHDKLDRRLDRTISPVIPPLKALAALTGKSGAGTTQTSILLRFLPACSNPSVPSLELTLLTSKNSEAVTPHSLRAISSLATHDILLPSHPVDIRLTNVTSYLLPGPSIASSCPEILAFLSSSDLRPQEGILSTPARPAPLRLPSRILSSVPPSSSRSETTEADYIFAGLELHRCVYTSVGGWKLSYTSIEAGQGGGRRAELALEGVRIDDRRVDDEGLPVSEFVRNVELDRERNQTMDGKEGKSEGAEGFVQTLSSLALGRQLAWVGEVPHREEGRKRERVVGGQKGGKNGDVVG